jgi:hypothetical protein
MQIAVSSPKERSDVGGGGPEGRRGFRAAANIRNPLPASPDSPQRSLRSLEAETEPPSRLRRTPPNEHFAHWGEKRTSSFLPKERSDVGGGGPEGRRGFRAAANIRNPLPASPDSPQRSLRSLEAETEPPSRLRRTPPNEHFVRWREKRGHDALPFTYGLQRRPG